jgi:hypothetical protein
MDPQHAERCLTSYLDAVQTWEHAQLLVAEAAALCEAALRAVDRAQTLRFQLPTVVRS